MENNRKNRIMLNISYLYYFDDKEDDNRKKSDLALYLWPFTTPNVYK